MTCIAGLLVDVGRPLAETGDSSAYIQGLSLRLCFCITLVYTNNLSNGREIE